MLEVDIEAARLASEREIVNRQPRRRHGDDHRFHERVVRRQRTEERRDGAGVGHLLAADDVDIELRRACGEIERKGIAPADLDPGTAPFRGDDGHRRDVVTELAQQREHLVARRASRRRAAVITPHLRAIHCARRHADSLGVPQARTRGRDLRPLHRQPSLLSQPQIDITPGRLATVTIVYGLICGLLAGTALWLLRALRLRLFGKPEANGSYRPHGFGFVVLAAFLAAAIYWMHLEVFRIYLPVGAVRVLSKATNLITATAFALLLLWFAERNADRRVSRILFVAGVLLIAISSVFLYQRRDSYRTEAHAVVVANIGTVAGQRPVIVVAIRNLPYDWILTLAGEGSLPFFEQARTHGYFTRLEPFPTMSAKSLWASVATGKLPFRHGVTGRLGYRTPLNRAGERFLIIPSGVGFKAWGLIPPVERISTPLPAGLSLPLWTVFERLGLAGRGDRLAMVGTGRCVARRHRSLLREVAAK